MTQGVRSPSQVGKRGPGLLLLPGWDEEEERTCRQLAELAGLGFVCTCAPWPERNGASTRCHTTTCADDLGAALRAFDELSGSEPVDPARIAVVGASCGGYLGALVTAVRDVRWLVLRAPALYNDWEASKDSVDRQGVAAYRRLLLRPEDNRAIAASACFRGDVLVVESEFDDTVPHAVIANYLVAFGNARTLTHRVLSGADHELSQDDWQQANAMLIQNWLTDQALRSLDA